MCPSFCSSAQHHKSKNTVIQSKRNNPAKIFKKKRSPKKCLVILYQNPLSTSSHFHTVSKHVTFFHSGAKANYNNNDGQNCTEERKGNRPFNSVRINAGHFRFTSIDDQRRKIGFSLIIWQMGLEGMPPKIWWWHNNHQNCSTLTRICCSCYLKNIFKRVFDL